LDPAGGCHRIGVGRAAAIVVDELTYPSQRISAEVAASQLVAVFLTTIWSEIDVVLAAKPSVADKAVRSIADAVGPTSTGWSRLLLALMAANFDQVFAGAMGRPLTVPSTVSEPPPSPT
jgi:hypothetical protein